MTIINLRIISTVLSLIFFVGIWIWAWSKSNKRDFDDASKLPFGDENE